MPTPFNHLVLADATLAHPGLPEGARRRLQTSRPSFLLGSTSPDVCSLTGVERETTHYFTMPMTDRRPAHLRLLELHPELGHPAALEDDQAAFLAGYLAHLWLDQAWIAAIFEPVFGPRVPRGSFHDRLTDHNLLRARLDQEGLIHLEPDIGEALGRCEPDGWLPSVSRDDLAHWRDHLARQLPPGGCPQTVEVFAERSGVPPDVFGERLASEREMERAVFRHLPPRRLEAFGRLGVIGTLELVSAYMEGGAASAPITATPFRLRLAPPYSPNRERP